MNMDHVYNKRDPRSIEAYAQQLIGKTFNDVIEYAVENKIAQETRVKFYGNKARKGGLGNLLEELKLIVTKKLILPKQEWSLRQHRMNIQKKENFVLASVWLLL